MIISDYFGDFSLKKNNKKNIDFNKKQSKKICSISERKQCYVYSCFSDICLKSTTVNCKRISYRAFHIILDYLQALTSKYAENTRNT